MSRTRMVDLLETFGTVEITDAKLEGWIASEVKRLRQNYCLIHDDMSQEKFAERAGLPWRTIYNIEKCATSPGIVTLNAILKAAETTLAEFFSDLCTRMELASIQRKSKDEQEMIEDCVRGLSDQRTKRVVADAARNVREMLSLIGDE